MLCNEVMKHLFYPTASWILKMNTQMFNIIAQFNGSQEQVYYNLKHEIKLFVAKINKMLFFYCDK